MKSRPIMIKDLFFKKIISYSLLSLIILLLSSTMVFAGTYYVSTTGSDSTGDGSQSNPWGTIRYAFEHVPDDGSTILVMDGDYFGQTKFYRHFTNGVTIKAQHPYKAKLYYNDSVIKVYGASNFTVEGFEITHSGPGAGMIIIHMAGSSVHDITLRNNIIHDSYENDVLKINDNAYNITVEGNIFYNQGDSDELMDINQVNNVEVRDNIFFNDYAGSGRYDVYYATQFIVVKNSGNSRPGGAEHVNIRRNIFLNFEGPQYGAMVRYGEDSGSYTEVANSVLENNLFLDTSGYKIQAPINFNGGNRAHDITIRNNTLVGDFDHTIAQSIRANGDRIFIYNNVFSDPTGTMQKWGSGSSTNSILDNNLYWNNGGAIPDGDGTLKPSLDGNAVFSDPKIPSFGNLVFPRYNSATGRFISGNTTIRQEFERLAELGMPASNSAVIDQANPSYSPSDDLFGNARDANPDIGAIEVGASQGQQTYQCSDNIDNDNDGLTDYPNDPGCSSSTDNNEYNVPSDTEAPTTPTNLQATAVSSSQINLSWNASTDNVGVAGYKIYRDGVQVASVSNTSYQDTGLSPSTSYVYTVTAYDSAGNESGQSASSQATTDSGASNPQGSFPLVLRGTPPEEKTITMNVSKPLNALDAQLAMTVNDPDFADEGELYVNGNGPLTLFGQFGSSSNDTKTVTFTMETPASWWQDGDNSLRFRHTRTSGYKIEDLTVNFTQGSSDTSPPSSPQGLTISIQ